MLGSAGFVDADAPQVRLNASASRRTNDIDAATKSHPPPGKGLTVRGQEELFACRWLAEQVLRHHDSTITPDTRTGVSISHLRWEII